MNNFIEKLIIPAIVPAIFSLSCSALLIYFTTRYITPKQLRKVEFNSLIDQLEREFDTILEKIVTIKSEQDFNNALSSFQLLQSKIRFIQNKIVKLYPKNKINNELTIKLRQLLTLRYSNQISQIQAEITELKNKTILGLKKKY